MDKETKAKWDEQRERVKAAKAAKLKALKKEPKVAVRFQNSEMPGVDVEFSYQGIARYHLFDGVTYELPMSVVDHLNDLKTPIYKQYDPDEERNTLRTDPARVEERISGWKNRFALIPVSMGDFVNAQGTQASTKQGEAHA